MFTVIKQSDIKQHERFLSFILNLLQFLTCFGVTFESFSSSNFSLFCLSPVVISHLFADQYSNWAKRCALLLDCVVSLACTLHIDQTDLPSWWKEPFEIKGSLDNCLYFSSHLKKKKNEKLYSCNPLSNFQLLTLQLPTALSQSHVVFSDFYNYIISDAETFLYNFVFFKTL